ncbi:MAG: hypothetical protein JF587_08905 [Catenulisporales bacterium]|nr:hypothetical protein [Catenulisporales bacterium]
MAEEIDDAARLVDAVFGATSSKKTTEPEAAEAVTDVGTDAAEGESGERTGAAPETVAIAEAGSAAGADDGDESAGEQASSGTKSPSFKAFTRTRLAAAAAVVIGVAAASVLVLSGGGSGNAATPGAAPSTQPSVNPQAFYPLQSASPFETGSKSPLTDAELLAAVPGCGSCKLVTRANGFSPDGAVLALFRTGAPQVGKPNFKLVVVGSDRKPLWSAPEGVKALTAGIERFSTDAAGNFYLALPGAKSGQILVALSWREGKVQDLGGLLDPKIKSDSIVGVLPQATGATATIVSQTTAGVPDADTGGLVESQYQIKDGRPVLIGCRRHVGESGQWIAFQPGADGCAHWPAGPVGPPDDDDPTAKP